MAVAIALVDLDVGLLLTSTDPLIDDSGTLLLQCHLLDTTEVVIHIGDMLWVNLLDANDRYLLQSLIGMHDEGLRDFPRLELIGDLCNILREILVAEVWRSRELALVRGIGHQTTIVERILIIRIELSGYIEGDLLIADGCND